MTTSHPDIKVFEIALTLDRGHIEVLKAIGEHGPTRAKRVLMPEARIDRPATGNMVFIHGAFKGLRRMGLARQVTVHRRSDWHLTTTGVQVYEQLFNSPPNLDESENEERPTSGG